MPPAAPGETTREVLHQVLPDYFSRYEPAWLEDEKVFSLRDVMESQLRQCIGALKPISSFTPQIPVFLVERGRLGEVESLVGDCRPPPPGNPHRPTGMGKKFSQIGWLLKNLDKYSCLSIFWSSISGIRGIISSTIRLHSFNRIKNLPNLKILNFLQYFKNIHSFLSCAERIPMLRFLRSHSHLYGIRQVGSPPIVITFVLKNKDNLHALSILPI